MTKFFVSRQCYYYSHVSVVEVVSGGIDNSGADMLCAVYPGEGQEYDDPVEAVETAIEVCKAWRKKYRAVHVAVGSTGGMGLELEPCTFVEARAWAQRWTKRLDEERVDTTLDVEEYA
jgi:hypothetical protein